MSHDAAHDMSRKLQASIADVLVREARIAQHVCTLPEISIMPIEASVMMVRTAAGTIANSIDDEAQAASIIDLTINGIIEQVRKSQGDILPKVLAERRSRAA